ncbi:hypothetical protein GYMLUDRAFT_583670 [Collybiopsis luxurians FD-317 M1]|uniref:Ubinuclein middle domain-containing protein n=1 Tax=Collybiopsis luxurians FD-317 M1 TaxID=944289 RepID=A0A0D0BZV4_9AGAR|nr:hypothetical protein GYMLUDRAFT_583670 [Collybiopsis luxurians FD-317 M1]
MDPTSELLAPPVETDMNEHSLASDNDDAESLSTFKNTQAQDALTEDEKAELSCCSPDVEPILINHLIEDTLPPPLSILQDEPIAGEASKESSENAGDAASGRSTLALTTVQYGSQATGLNAPLKGNIRILEKLQWSKCESNPSEKGQSKDHTEKYGDGEEGTGTKRKLVNDSREVTKKKKKIDMTSFSPQMQDSLERLKAVLASTPREKGNMPDSVEPLLAQAVIQAINFDEYDEKFFKVMPTILSMDTVTTTKLIKCKVFKDHLKLLVNRQDALLDELKRQIDKEFPKVKKKWETRKSTSLSHFYPVNENLKAIIWELVLLVNERHHLHMEKDELEGVVSKRPSVQTLRGQLYEKIISKFPKGWKSIKGIIDQVNRIKKRVRADTVQQKS